MEYMEFSAKTKNDAITAACTHFVVTSDKLEYEVVSEAKSGFLGINSKPAVIRARVREDVMSIEDAVEAAISPSSSSSKKSLLKNSESKSSESKKPESTNSDVKESASKESASKNLSSADDFDVQASAEKFLNDVFKAMGLEVVIESKYNASLRTLDIELKGDEMGVLIGKRGQTLDSLQYLISLVVNKGTSEYIRVKVDSENYRLRRKETLENLARNISYKVKRTKRPVSLEPMNPYERRIIHSALQNDKYVTTYSEGEEPFRRVVVTLRK